MRLFHPSIEGAQHGAKGLDGFLEFAVKSSGVATFDHHTIPARKYPGFISNGSEMGVQPTNFMLEDGKGGFLPADVIKDKIEGRGLILDGISAHCPFWVHTTAWTGSPTIRPFIPAELHKEPVEKIEAWVEEYILRLLQLCSDLDVGVVPMFWGHAWGLEVASGYPWGFWSGPGYDLLAEGDERFIEKTENIRNEANELRIVLAHEIHPNAGVMCARDFLHLDEICDNDECIVVNADPSHCWEGESWQDRFDLVAGYVYGCHMKNHHVRPGQPLRSMISEWPRRAMQFSALDRGDIDLIRYVEQMIRIGYRERYLDRMGKTGGTAPLVVEAEGAYENLDDISTRGIEWVRDNCCFDVAEGSFEDGMGADK